MRNNDIERQRIAAKAKADRERYEAAQAGGAALLGHVNNELTVNNKSETAALSDIFGAAFNQEETN